MQRVQVELPVSIADLAIQPPVERALSGALKSRCALLRGDLHALNPKGSELTVKGPLSDGLHVAERARTDAQDSAFVVMYTLDSDTVRPGSFRQCLVSFAT